MKWNGGRMNEAKQKKNLMHQKLHLLFLFCHYYYYLISLVISNFRDNNKTRKKYQNQGVRGTCERENAHLKLL